MYIDGCINLIVEIYVCIPQDYDTFQVVKLEIYEFFDEIPWDHTYLHSKEAVTTTAWTRGWPEVMLQSIHW